MTRAFGSDAFSTTATGVAAGLPRGDQRRRDGVRLTDAHIDGAGIGGGDASRPFVCSLALADARRDQADGARQAALRQRNPDLRARRQRRRDARHHLVAHAGRLERVDLLLRAAEEHRIAALEAHDDRVLGAPHRPAAC